MPLDNGPSGRRVKRAIRQERAAAPIANPDEIDPLAMMSRSPRQPDAHELVAELTNAPRVSRASSVQRLQRAAGNQSFVSVLRRAARRAKLQPVEQQMQIPLPEPIVVTRDDVGSGPGDYELPKQHGTAMAKHIQRDDDKPGLRGDVSGGGSVPVVTPSNNPATGAPPPPPSPFTVSSTVVLKNVDLLHLPRLHLDIGHEPSLQLQIDPNSGLSAQAAIALLNLHWMPFWNREVELSLSPFIQTTLAPLAFSQAGLQLQAEAHVTGTVSFTLSTTGAYQAPQPGQNGGLSVTGGAGVLVHVDWDKIL